jgi:hypothetical protein
MRDLSLSHTLLQFQQDHKQEGVMPPQKISAAILLLALLSAGSAYAGDDCGGFPQVAASDDPEVIVPDETNAAPNPYLTRLAQAGGMTVTDTPAVTVAKAAISQKSSSTNKTAPTALDAGEIVKGRLGESGKSGQYHYWKVTTPPGEYRLILDVKRSDDQHSNIQTAITAFNPDGSEAGNVIATNDIEFRTRAAAKFEKKDTDLILRVSNDNSIVDYWLGIFPSDSNIPAPFFAKPPMVKPLEFGKAEAMTLDPKPGAPAESWYSVSLKATDYKITAEFKRADSQSSNVQASVDIFGPIGEEAGMDKQVCAVNEIDVAATCTSKLVLAQDANVLLRVSPSNEAAYKTTLKIEPLD